MKAAKLHVYGSRVTLDVVGQGILTADFSKWKSLVANIGGSDQIKAVKLLRPEILEFPNNIFVEVKTFVDLAKKQSFLKTALAAITRD